MNLRTARGELASGIAAGPHGVTGYARPPGQVGRFPAAIVRDPTAIRYHTARASRVEVDLPVFVIVGRAAAQESTDELDELVSDTALPALIDGLTGSWSTLFASDLAGPYVDFVQGGHIVGLAATINTQLVFK